MWSCIICCTVHIKCQRFLVSQSISLNWSGTGRIYRGGKRLKPNHLCTHTVCTKLSFTTHARTLIERQHCTHTQTHTYTDTHAHTHIHTDTHVRTHTHAHTHAHTDTHTHTVVTQSLVLTAQISPTYTHTCTHTHTPHTRTVVAQRSLLLTAPWTNQCHAIYSTPQHALVT